MNVRHPGLRDRIKAELERAAREGEERPTLMRLKDLFGCCRYTVQHHIARLERGGWSRPEPRRDPASPRRCRRCSFVGVEDDFVGASGRAGVQCGRCRAKAAERAERRIVRA